MLQVQSSRLGAGKPSIKLLIKSVLQRCSGSRGAGRPVRSSYFQFPFCRFEMSERQVALTNRLTVLVHCLPLLHNRAPGRCLHMVHVEFRTVSLTVQVQRLMSDGDCHVEHVADLCLESILSVAHLHLATRLYGTFCRRTLLHNNCNRSRWLPKDFNYCQSVIDSDKSLPKWSQLPRP